MKQTNHNASPARPTIGFLIPNIKNPWERRQWRGVVDAAGDYGCNLLCFTGGALRSPEGFEAQANALYDLLSPESVDGVLMWSGSLSGFESLEAFEVFCHRYDPLPIICIERKIPGFPGVLMDNYQAMRTIMAHLIDEHGYRRLAFIRGRHTHTGFQERYRAYTEALEEAGLAVDLTLLYEGEDEVQPISDWLQADGRLDDVEAIVSYSDRGAQHALQALQNLGIRVPEEMAVIGYNDLAEAAASTPPLTTTRVPFYEMGYTAVELLLVRIRGEAVPARTTLPNTLVIRQSCGCLDPIVTRAKIEMIPANNTVFASDAVVQRSEILTGIASKIGNGVHVLEWAAQVVDAFTEEFTQGSSELFLKTLQRVLGEYMAQGKEIARWQDGLSELRCRMLPLLEADTRLQAENVWQQARVVLSSVAERVQLASRLHMERQVQTLDQLEAELITTFDVESLMNKLADGMPNLGIPGAFLALYDVPPEAPQHPKKEQFEYRQYARLILAYNEQGRMPTGEGGMRFASQQLVPEGMLPQHRRSAMVVKPLYFQEKQLGFMLLEVGPPEGHIYEALRVGISSALQGALLLQRVQDHAHELAQYRDHLEELVQKRTTELNKINILLHQEIRERSRAQQALQVSEQQYRLLAENVQDGMIILQDGRLVFVNAIVTNMCGYGTEHLMKIDPLTLFPPAGRTVFGRYLTGDFDADAPEWQTEMLTKDGRSLWIEIKAGPLLWNEQAALLLTVRNITERKVREQRMEEERSRLEQENLSLRSTIKERFRFGELVGKSAAMQRIYELTVSAASSDVNVLIVGESGTGKELIAKTLYQVSPRREQPFVPVNCASIPETLFEREFFGHRKGSFTGADRDKPGLFDKAHQGILFLDEVTELTPGTQAKLLRVLQDGRYTPLGSPELKQADVLILAATNKDPQQEIRDKRLRQDFFYRVGVIEMTVPPLRERKDDLPLLIEHLLQQYHNKQQALHGERLDDGPVELSTLPGELVQALYAYNWPGNIRELQNVLQRYVVTRDLNAVCSRLGATTPEPPNVAQPALSFTATPAMSFADAVQRVEKQVITDALEQTDYRVGKTADLLHMPRRTLHNKLKKYGFTLKRTPSD